MNFADKIDSLLFSGATFELVYMEEGDQKRVSAVIGDLVGEKGGESMILKSGLRIPFDKIVRVDGLLSPFVC